jgi:branched-chain amino acid transport system ATP-binding protein
VLSVIDLHTYYGDSHVLQGVSLQVEKGTIAAVLGRNGMGKTTLCRSLVGLTPARAGRIVFNGTEITHLPPHRICGEHIGLVPQGRRIFASLTVEEHLAIASGKRGREGFFQTGPEKPLPTPFSGWDVEKVFALFPRLRERRHHRGNELSGGEQQMLAIARALMANPVLLVMDEPTEGLAPALVAEVAALIRQLKQEGTAILLVEQNAAFAVRVADYVHVMSKGKIVHSSEPMALWNNEEIKTKFLGVPAAT